MLVKQFAEDSNFKEMNAVLNHRTVLNWTMPNLLITAKQFEVMQHPAFDAVISKHWSGSVDMAVHMFYCSSSFRLLCQTPLQ